MGRKADYFCFDWAFFCKVSGFLGRLNVRYNSNVTHWLLSHLLLLFFFFNNKFNLEPRSLVFFVFFCFVNKKSGYEINNKLISEQLNLVRKAN